LFDWVETLPYGNNFFGDTVDKQNWTIEAVHHISDCEQNCIKFFCDNRLVFSFNLDTHFDDVAIVCSYSNVDEDICITLYCNALEDIPELVSWRKNGFRHYYLQAAMSALNTKIKEAKDLGVTGGVTINI
jgi:hypothetical protein